MFARVIHPSTLTALGLLDMSVDDDRQSDRIARIQSLAASRPGIEGVLVAWLEAMTDATRETYAADLAAFAAWAGTDESRALESLFSGGSPRANAIVLQYRADLLAYRDERGKGYAPATVARRLSALRSVAKIARLTGIFSGDIEIPSPKICRVRDVRGPGPAAYAAMLRILDLELDRDVVSDRRRWECVRDRAVLRLLHDCCLRRIEVVRLDRDDVDGIDLRVRPKGPRAAVVMVPVSRKALEALEAWLDARGGHAGPLFVAWHRDTRLAPSTVNRLVARVAASAGVQCRPHGLRHTAITTALDRSGGDVRAVAALARHQDPSTTLRYDDRRHEAARNLADMIAEEG